MLAGGNFCWLFVSVGWEMVAGGSFWHGCSVLRLCRGFLESWLCKFRLPACWPVCVGGFCGLADCVIAACVAVKGIIRCVRWPSFL